MHIIDRRLNPGGKSFSNRQRFLRRVRDQLVGQVLNNRKIGADGKIEVDTRSLDGINEPRFHHDPSKGIHDRVLPGNKKYIVGDTIPRPQGGGGSPGNEAGQGDGLDPYKFYLTREEFEQLFFEDLELPDLDKKAIQDITATQSARSGLSNTGSPSNLDFGRTARKALGRRIALGRPKLDELEALRQDIGKMKEAGAPEDDIAVKQVELDALLSKRKRIPYIDTTDLRYRNFEQRPKPNSQAVMFCLMDVSGSMTEQMKDLAKRFYTLLYIFLKKRHERIDLVFIRHTENAEEVDENTFFYDPKTGGTKVSAALEKMAEIIKSRYPPDAWNIYAAQASDGDNQYNDGSICEKLMRNVILPVTQFFAYIEVKGQPTDVPSDLWKTYQKIVDPSFAMQKIASKTEIIQVFRQLFRRRERGTAASPSPQVAALG